LLFNTEIIDIDRIFVDENTTIEDLQHSSSCLSGSDEGDKDCKKPSKKEKNKDPKKDGHDHSIVINKEALLN
jgi:hypothetical protein